MFGSTANTLSLQGSDIDIMIYEESMKSNENLSKLYSKTFTKLTESDKFKFVIPIGGAEVPIIKVVHAKSDI